MLTTPDPRDRKVFPLRMGFSFALISFNTGFTVFCRTAWCLCVSNTHILSDWGITVMRFGCNKTAKNTVAKLSRLRYSFRRLVHGVSIAYHYCYRPTICLLVRGLILKNLSVEKYYNFKKWVTDKRRMFANTQHPWQRYIGVVSSYLTDKRRVAALGSFC
jgi:hypothetical protein